jgi:hypothetical protein
MNIMFIPYRKNLRSSRGGVLRVLAFTLLAALLSLAFWQSDAQAQFFPQTGSGQPLVATHSRANAGYWQHTVGTARPWWKNPGRYPLDAAPTAAPPILTPGWNNSSVK